MAMSMPSFVFLFFTAVFLGATSPAQAARKKSRAITMPTTDLSESSQDPKNETDEPVKDFGDHVVDAVGQVKDVVLDTVVGSADGVVRIAHKFNLDLLGPEKNCIADRLDKLGCFSGGCTCGWRHRCFPRFMLVADADGHYEAFNMGVCDTDMRFMLFGSVCFFTVFWLGSLVLMRVKFPLTQKEFYQNLQVDETTRGEHFGRGVNPTAANNSVERPNADQTKC